jgi:hypothetical protein
MADKNSLIEQMLENLVNDEQQKAEELFHEYVVAKSREIYEGLIDSEISEEEEEDKEEDKEDEDVEEGFDEFASEADDDEMDLDTEDPTDDLAAELGDDEEGDDMEDKSEDELFQDLDAIVGELEARFAEMGDEDSDMGDDEMKDSIEPELETVREYVENVPTGHGAEKKGQAEKADNTKSAIDNMKNDMGGTTTNILSSKEDSGSKGTAGGLANNKPQDMKTGNINVPGGKAGGAFSKKEPGHGAEKKGASEGSTDGQSLFRGRR